MDIEIKTRQVRRGGEGTQSAAEKAMESLGKFFDSSETVAGNDHGWASAGALKRCATAWENHLIDLAKQMNRMAENLHRTANDYDATDRQARDAMRRLQHGLDDFGGK
ncbi:type VII secretion target [Streptomyces varsoviensis]|uniref:ESAT-6-like protein n=1 Tax=Streptomyces varsoviensis TaxID=67373 RepID=A0ABR5IXJ0_9ACTN|nr:type VII secretion target [Streptomyces varsoviensis]KOG85691.1 hypothetical protein ADK38_35245 [Streptomyces varsoviensis]